MSSKAKSCFVSAVGYLRKSTKGERVDGRQRQEKSIDQQKTEIIKLAQTSGYRIVRWYTDAGVSGWKRGAQRPEFYRMLQDAKDLADFKAVLVDDVDRFSRAK